MVEELGQQEEIIIFRLPFQINRFKFSLYPMG